MKREEITGLFENIAEHCSDYRTRFAVALAAFSEHKPARDPLFDLLVVTSKLYLDCLLVLKHSSELYAFANDSLDTEPYSSDTGREMDLRRRLKTVLGESKSWDQLTLNHSMADPPLMTRDGYVNSYALHLPEIHEETFRVQRCAEDFIATRSDNALINLETDLKHLSFNHALLVLPALQWPATG